MAQDDIQIVIFDLGRVLIRICDNWQQACKLAAVPYPPRADQIAYLKEAHEIGFLHEKGLIDSDAFYQRTATLFDCDAKHIQASSVAWLIEPFPRVADLIQSLKDAGLKTACLSNTNEKHWQMMHLPGDHHLPLDMMDHQFASHLIGIMKPDAAIYAHVEKQTQIKPSAIVFFDDNADNIAAAKKRGWQAHLVPSGIADTVSWMQNILQNHQP